jgi:glycosyltransferase involved in cell wall biosynthesis
MTKLSIIIPFLNEGEEPINTINSIDETSNKEDVEIILIDDGSSDGEDLSRFEKFSNVRFFRNEIRIGTGYCIEFGLEKSSSPYILIVDAHMRFLNDDWLNKIVDKLKEDDKLLLCTVSIALNYDNKDDWDKNKPFKELKEHHSGTDLLPFYTINKKSKVLLDPRWRNLEKDKGDFYDIHCVMGACYASSKKWMQHIKSTNGLKQWGSIEESLSLKTWLAGGSVKLLSSTGIGHIYRNIKVPYDINADYVLYNKLWLIYTIFDDKTIYNMFNFISVDDRYKIPMKMLNENILEAKKLKKYYKSIFTRDKNFLEKIGINFNENIFIKLFELKEYIKDLEEELKIYINSLSEYNKMLISLDNNTDITTKKNKIIKNKILNINIPKLNNEINNRTEKIKDLEIEYEKTKPTRSVFGYD